jgi:hypothetical protein
MTLYKTVLCYYDGVQELFEYAKCECAITFANVGKVSYHFEHFYMQYIVLDKLSTDVLLHAQT